MCAVIKQQCQSNNNTLFGRFLFCICILVCIIRSQLLHGRRFGKNAMVINEYKRFARVVVLSFSLFSTVLSLQCGYQSTVIINQYATSSSIHSPRASRQLPLQTYRHMKRARCGRLFLTQGGENGDDASNEVRGFDVFSRKKN